MAHILIVEDDPRISATLGKLLTSRGHQVQRVENGAQALLTAHAELPDLILMDMAMPVLGGQEALEALQREERTAGIPVIVLSGLADDDTQAHALAAGASIYLIKPPAVRELLVLVERLLLLRQEGDGAV
jgi:DNA-binding response OmpR family regulator